MIAEKKEQFKIHLQQVYGNILNYYRRVRTSSVKRSLTAQASTKHTPVMPYMSLLETPQKMFSFC